MFHKYAMALTLLDSLRERTINSLKAIELGLFTGGSDEEHKRVVQARENIQKELDSLYNDLANKRVPSGL